MTHHPDVERIDLTGDNAPGDLIALASDADLQHYVAEARDWRSLMRVTVGPSGRTYAW